jgi:hypothetical protein
MFFLHDSLHKPLHIFLTQLQAWPHYLH